MQTITKNDLLTIIEDVGYGSMAIGGADRNGVVVNGYLNLSAMAKRLDMLVARRMRHEASLNEQAH